MSPARAAVAAVLIAGPVVGDAAAQPPADVLLEQRVTAALAADPRLGRLTVSVVDRVAVVGGPVPDAAARRTAEAAVRGVAGLAAVRLNCWLPLPADPFADRVRGQLGRRSAERGTPAPKPGPWEAGDLPPLALLLPGAEPGARAAEPDPPTDGSSAFRAPSSASSGRGWLGPPVAGAAGTIPPPAVPAVPPARFARLTAADPRFRRLTVEVSPAGVATIGGAGDPAAAWDLAEQVRHQPGVARVVVGPVADR